jgi:hypothetical protein
MNIKDLLRSFINFQMWMIKNMNALYLWGMLASALSYAIILYCASHRTSVTIQICYLLFMYYASFKIIVR